MPTAPLALLLPVFDAVVLSVSFVRFARMRAATATKSIMWGLDHRRLLTRRRVVLRNTQQRAELLRLRRENSDLKLDRAFLKKAALVTHPWAVSGGCAAGERRAHAAEIEHGKGDEWFG